jgi:hypothetical protein
MPCSLNIGTFIKKFYQGNQNAVEVLNGMWSPTACGEVMCFEWELSIYVTLYKIKLYNKHIESKFKCKILICSSLLAYLPSSGSVLTKQSNRIAHEVVPAVLRITMTMYLEE